MRRRAEFASDELPTVEAAYGLARRDLRARCGRVDFTMPETDTLLGATRSLARSAGRS